MTLILTETVVSDLYRVSSYKAFEGFPNFSFGDKTFSIKGGNVMEQLADTSCTQVSAICARHRFWISQIQNIILENRGGAPEPKPINPTPEISNYNIVSTYGP